MQIEYLESLTEMCPIQHSNTTSKLILINIWFLIYGGGTTSFGVVGEARISVIWPYFETVLTYLLPMRASFQGVSEKKIVESSAFRNEKQNDNSQ